MYLSQNCFCLRQKYYCSDTQCNCVTYPESWWHSSQTLGVTGFLHHLIILTSYSICFWGSLIIRFSHNLEITYSNSSVSSLANAYFSSLSMMFLPSASLTRRNFEICPRLYKSNNHTSHSNFCALKSSLTQFVFYYCVLLT